MQDFTRNTSSKAYSPAAAAVSEAAFFQKVYGWMGGGLALTAVIAYALAHSPAYMGFLFRGGTGLVLVMAVIQIGLVIAIGRVARNSNSSVTVCRGLFLAYAASVGMITSIVLLVYPTTVIFKAFVSTAAIYGAMAVYGMVTKRSLQAWGSFLFMGLVGLIVASLINIFAQSQMADFVICGIGVLLFAGLTAYDHQKLRVIYAGGFENDNMEGKIIIQGALELYLDFINLFFFLLRLLGNRD